MGQDRLREVLKGLIARYGDDCFFRVTLTDPDARLPERRFELHRAGEEGRAAMTYLWAEGQPIEVSADRLGRPQRLTWRGRAHPVAHIANRWRVDEEWWRGQRIWREYFKLATRTGLLVVVYHDLDGGAWYLQRLYD